MRWIKKYKGDIMTTLIECGFIGSYVCIVCSLIITLMYGKVNDTWAIIFGIGYITLIVIVLVQSIVDIIKTIKQIKKD